MKSTPKWLLIPPAVALLLILGPMSMGGGSSSDPNQSPASAQPAATIPTSGQPASTRIGGGQPNGTQPNGSGPNGNATTPNGSDKAIGSLVPRTPDMWKMASAFVGVMLLGVGALIVLKRLRGGATPSGSTALATLRQTIRLTTKQSLHAIEFDNRIILVGETDKGLSLIDRGSLPDAESDEATVLARQEEEADDDGAVPRNLVIPRPVKKSNRAPKQPSVAPAQEPSKADAAIQKLNDFRTLLEKAGR